MSARVRTLQSHQHTDALERARSLVVRYAPCTERMGTLGPELVDALKRTEPFWLMLPYGKLRRKRCRLRLH